MPSKTLFSKRVLSTIALASIALSLSIWMAETPQDSDTKATASTLSNLTWQAKTTQTWYFEENQSQTRIAAKQVQYSQAEAMAILTQMQAQQINPELTLVDADSATLKNSRFLQLNNNVVIHQPAQEAATIKTESLNADLQLKTFATDDFVTITQNQMNTEATGLKYDANLGILTLNSQVKTVYIPNNSAE